MPPAKKLAPEDRAKIGIPCDVSHRFDVLMDIVKNRIMEGAYVLTARREAGAKKWHVNDEDVWASACHELRETADMLESQLTTNAKRTLRNAS